VRAHGFYLNSTPKRGLGALRKADAIVEDFGAERIAPPSAGYAPPEGKDLVCVVENGPFDAARVCDARDVLDFLDPTDRRARTWLLVQSNSLEGFAR
jgi:hypothetical protein